MELDESVPLALEMEVKDNFTDVQSIEDASDGCKEKYRVEVTVEGGFMGTFGQSDDYRIRSVLGLGNPETVTFNVVPRGY